MKTKIKILKRDIDRYLSILEEKYPLAKLVSSAIDGLLLMKVDDRIIHAWYRSIENFIEKIEKEIEILDDELFTYENIFEFKKEMDKYYDLLNKRHKELFLTIYQFVEYILEDDELNKYQKESFKNIYSSIEIIQEEIKRIEDDG